jgi:hypothetical protein
MAPKFDFGKSGLADLDSYLLTRSYIEGYVPQRGNLGEMSSDRVSHLLWGLCRPCRYSFSPADTSVFGALPVVPDAGSTPHAYRWYLHIAALSGIPA